MELTSPTFDHTRYYSTAIKPLDTECRFLHDLTVSDHYQVSLSLGLAAQPARVLSKRMGRPLTGRSLTNA
jgi:hypothetical protein